MLAITTTASPMLFIPLANKPLLCLRHDLASISVASTDLLIPNVHMFRKLNCVCVCVGWFVPRKWLNTIASNFKLISILNLRNAQMRINATIDEIANRLIYSAWSIQIRSAWITERHSMCSTEAWNEGYGKPRDLSHHSTFAFCNFLTFERVPVVHLIFISRERKRFSTISDFALDWFPFCTNDVC